jgi:hypothetical protein
MIASWRTSMLLLFMCSMGVKAAPELDLLEFWAVENPSSDVRVDHSPWQRLLDNYLDAEHQSGINRFDYDAVEGKDIQALDVYLGQLQAIDPRRLNRKEQMAYWINLYNAATVALVLNHEEEIDSITEIKANLFSFGPWSIELLEIQRRELSLDNIEHGILRPIWQDHRIHFALNCASLGCPNLSPEVYTADSLESALSRAETEYLNHARAVSVDNGALVLSSLFDWYRDDFAVEEQGLRDYIKMHVESALSAQVSQLRSIRYAYDWRLNRP